MRRAILLLGLVGCSAGRSCSPSDPRFQAAMIAESLRSLEQDPGSYELLLARLDDRMAAIPDSPTVEAVHALTVRVRPRDRSDEVCPSDAIGAEVQRRLAALKDHLLTGSSTITADAPQVCRTTPRNLPELMPTGELLTIRFLGWDLDRPKLKLLMLNADGSETEVSTALRRKSQFAVEADWGSDRLGPSPGVESVVLRAGDRELARLELKPHRPPFALTITEAESRPAQHPQVEVQIPAGHLLLGGGCLAKWKLAGQLLTASHPTSSGWACAAKDHTTPEIGTVRAYALSIPADSGLEVTTATAVSESANHPKARAELPPGYTLIGGGCAVDFGTGAGNLLVNTFPEGQAWACEAKDHVAFSPGVLTAWAIGLKLPAGLRLVREEVTSSLDHHPHVGALLPMDGTMLIGGGCRTDYSSSGSMLWSSYPSVSANGWLCAAKDHRANDRATLTATALGLVDETAP